MISKSNTKKFYITTSIAYTNAKPHIGHALEFIQADVVARSKRIEGDDTYFLTGTDDHGIKIYRSACEAKKTPKEFVDRNIKEFKRLIKNLNISNNDFISTSDEKRHWPGAQALWKRLDETGDIYKKKYKGLYCVGCESFVTSADLVEGKCPAHQKEPEVIEEKNYFFKLSKYKKEIKEKIEHDEIKIIPVERKHEVLNIISELEDISFSRPKGKLPWGVPVPGDDSQVMYVWCDALSNYITALGYGTKNDAKFKKYWPADVHCIGKDILKFHAVIWPAMLLSAGIKLPKEIFVHGYITSNGQKMSKSVGNVIDPFEVINKYGADALRYFLLRESPSTQDLDFNWEAFKSRYNSDLANDLGNLVMRVVTLANKLEIKTWKRSDILKKIDTKSIESYQFSIGLKKIWEIIIHRNKDIEDEQVWKLIKDDPKTAKVYIIQLLNWIDNIANYLEPYLPSTSKRIEAQLKFLKPEPLFPKVK